METAGTCRPRRPPLFLGWNAYRLLPSENMGKVRSLVLVSNAGERMALRHEAWGGSLLRVT
jgi:hypothetical protein